MKGIKGLLVLSCFLLNGCILDIFKETVTIERTVNAVWSADNKEILKVISTYETKNTDEKYYNTRWAKNWNFRFEICNPDLTVRDTAGYYEDWDKGGRLQYVSVFWLPKVNKILTAFPGQETTLINLDGTEKTLETPAAILETIFDICTEPLATDFAPSPNENIIVVYYQCAYLTSSNFTDFSYIQCITFFDVETGNPIFVQEIPLPKKDPYLFTGRSDYHRRSHFLWAKDGSGVYIITRDKAYFIRYGANQGISEVNLVPELGLITNSGPVSNDGRYLNITLDNNETSLEVKQLDGWIPFSDLKLIPLSENKYSFE
jgi:hypothetical protein